MALTDTTSIDLITLPLPGDTFALVLYIVDSELDADEERRYELLCKKLKTYAYFVSTIDFKRKYPNVHSESVLIRVLTTKVPNDAMKSVTEVGPTSGTWPMKVVFDEYQTFVDRLKKD